MQYFTRLFIIRNKMVKRKRLDQRQKTRLSNKSEQFSLIIKMIRADYLDKINPIKFFLRYD